MVERFQLYECSCRTYIRSLNERIFISSVKNLDLCFQLCQPGEANESVAEKMIGLADADNCYLIIQLE